MSHPVVSCPQAQLGGRDIATVVSHKRGWVPWWRCSPQQACPRQPRGLLGGCTLFLGGRKRRGGGRTSPCPGSVPSKDGLEKDTHPVLFKFKTTSRQTKGFWWSMGQLWAQGCWGDREWSQSLLPVVGGTAERGGSMRGETEPWRGRE